MRKPLLLRFKEEVFDPEFETILHPTPLRLKWLGIFMLLGHPFFWYIWTAVSPQPYENIYVRISLGLLGSGLLYKHTQHEQFNKWALRYFSIVCWIQLPVFFSWMYWMNGGNAVWFATLVTIILLYFHVTDWRLATIGFFTGTAVGTLCAYWQLGALPVFTAASFWVICFAFFVALALAASSANLRRERLRHALVVIGIMAHELRTPLATASLISQAMLSEATNNDERSRLQRLNKLSHRLESLTRTIHHHIDLQMMNARFMQLPPSKQLISATGLVNQVVTHYPFGSKKEEDCIEVIMHEDFWFFGSERQFTQVLNNLLKNALHSLKAAQSRFSPGDLRIELGTRSSTGRITVADKGMGISTEHIAHIFEPFFSTNHDTGHGLGLAYCKQVIQASGGTIRVKSEPAVGAAFMIELPAQDISSPNSNHHGVSSLSSA